MNFAGIIPSQIRAVVVLFTGLGLAVFLGLKAGSGEAQAIFKVGAGILLVMHLLWFARYTVFLGLLVSSFDVQFYPGFYMGAHEQTAALWGLLLVGFWWLKRKEIKLDEDLVGFSIFRTLLVICICYLVGHFVLNYLDPTVQEGFSVKGMLKQDVRYHISFIIIGYFIARSSGQFLSRRPSITAARVISAALGFNIIIRLLFYLDNSGIERGETGEPGGASFLIPGLRMTDNVFALRTIAPMAAALAAAFYTSKAPNRPSDNLCRIMLLLSFVGAALSAGRASVIFCFFLAGVVFVLRRRGALVTAMAAVFALVLMLVNLFPDTYVRPLPWVLKRSVAKLVITEDMEEEASIAGSTNWRARIFLVAFDHWRNGDARLFWTGQAVSSFTNLDLFMLQNPNLGQADQTALRLGGTHNLITDLLVMWGLIGFLFYYGICIALINFLWRWHRRCVVTWETNDWTLVSLILVIFYLVYASIGGTAFWCPICWFIAYAALIYRREGNFEAKGKPGATKAAVMHPNRHPAMALDA
jgi:hypothetical protein